MTGWNVRFAYLWLIACAVLGLWLVVDLNREVHGHADPTLCTDCAQFARYLEELAP